MKLESINRHDAPQVVLDSMNEKPLMSHGYGLMYLPNKLIDRLNLISSCSGISTGDVLSTALDLYCEKYMR